MQGGQVLMITTQSDEQPAGNLEDGVDEDAEYPRRQGWIGSDIAARPL
jgi:hypothetical protein